MARIKSELTRVIKSIYEASDDVISFGDVDAIIYQAQVNSVCLAIPGDEIGDLPRIMGWYKWEEVLPHLSPDTRRAMSDAVNEERIRRANHKVELKMEHRIERQELRAAEQAALKEMEGMIFEEPKPALKPSYVGTYIYHKAEKRAKKVEPAVSEPRILELPRGWRIDLVHNRAVSPKGGEWVITKNLGKVWSLRNSRGTTMSIDINGHVDTMQH